MNLWFSKLWVYLIKKGHVLPMGVRESLARGIAFLLWWAIPKRRHVTLTNLALCFPELDEKERKALAHRVYQRLARAALDHGTLWVGSQDEIRDFVHVEGLEHFLNAINRPEAPVIIVAPHFAGLDAAGIVLSTYVKGVSLYQKQSNPVWDKAALEGRSRFMDPILVAKSDANDLRPVIRAMRQGLPFYYLPDMDHGRQNSIFVPFFGVPAATIPMVSRLAKLTRAKVFWCIATMTERGYHVVFSPALDHFPTADYVVDTERLNRELEDWIRAYPDQYLWTHRRFKTRPEGEPSVYDAKN